MCCFSKYCIIIIALNSMKDVISKDANANIRNCSNPQ